MTKKVLVIERCVDCHYFREVKDIQTSPNNSWYMCSYSAIDLFNDGVNVLREISEKCKLQDYKEV